MDLHNRDITLQCDDGERLAATLFSPASEPIGAVMVAPATGIKRQFYANFASHLANQGYAVLTFDNRGIGGSLHTHVSKSHASLIDWGQLDMTAALNTLMTLYPDSQYHLIGHSAGGQLVGLMPNHHKLSSILTFASSSGSLRNMKWPFCLSAHYFMNLFIPINNALFGHTKSQWVGMGEPLPKRVAQQWRKWCNGRGYVKTDFGDAIDSHHFEQVTSPSLWLYASDDHIAVRANVKDMISVYPQLPAELVELVPAQHDMNAIGHMKFFSRQAKNLWPIATDWLARHHVSDVAQPLPS